MTSTCLRVLYVPYGFGIIKISLNDSNFKRISFCLKIVDDKRVFLLDFIRAYVRSKLSDIFRDYITRNNKIYQMYICTYFRNSRK